MFVVDDYLSQSQGGMLPHMPPCFISLANDVADPASKASLTSFIGCYVDDFSSALQEVPGVGRLSGR